MNRQCGVTFRQIQQKPYFRHVPVGTLCSVSHGAEVPNKYRKAMGLPLLVKVPEDQVRKDSQPPRQLTRCTVYPTTDVDKIISDLYRVTGKTFYIMEDELEY